MSKSAAKKTLIFGAFAFIFCAICLAGITYFALESGDVVVAHTQSIQGESRETHIWFAKDLNLAREDDSLMLEAGHPDNPWVQDLVHGSTLVLEGQGITGEYTYTLHSELSNNHIRHLMRNKYGWRDIWITWLFDTSQSYPISVRLKPSAGNQH